MYINFQQNQSSRSVKMVHTNIFAKNRKAYICNFQLEVLEL